ncbi:MAG: hypothetical protein J5545_01460 [Bacteroidaceae bacterium]|nr:hypothetical protein [Bacteroidaceae bacterium]
MKIVQKIRQATAVMLSLFLLCTPSFADDNAKVEKACRKQCKQEVKRLQEEGWQVYGSSQTLEEVLLPYYLELAAGAQHITEKQSGPNINVALSKAKLFAQKQYAAAIESAVKAEVQNELANTEADSVQTEQRFRASYQSKVDQRIKDFVPRFTLTRKQADDKVEVIQYYTYKF